MKCVYLQWLTHTDREQLSNSHFQELGFEDAAVWPHGRPRMEQA